MIQKARWFGWLRVIFADAAYSGQLVTWVHEFFGRQGTRLSIVSRLGHGFRLLAKRWIVERTFSWLTHSRRLVITEKIDFSTGPDGTQFNVRLPFESPAHA